MDTRISDPVSSGCLPFSFQRGCSIVTYEGDGPVLYCTVYEYERSTVISNQISKQDAIGSRSHRGRELRTYGVNGKRRKEEKIVLEAYDDPAESPVGSGRLNTLGRRAAMRRLTRGTQEIQETHNSGQLPTKQVSHATLSHEQNVGTERAISGDRIGARIARQQKSPPHNFFPDLRRLHGIPQRASKAPWGPHRFSSHI